MAILPTITTSGLLAIVGIVALGMKLKDSFCEYLQEYVETNRELEKMKTNLEHAPEGE